MTLKRVSAVLTALIVLIGELAVEMPGEVYAAKAKKPAKVKWTSVKRSGLKITVKWKKAKNAKKYQVYQKIGSGKWRLKKALKKLMLTVKGAYGKTYRFKVRGVNGKKKGKFSSVKKVTIPKKRGGKTPDPEPVDPDPGEDDPKPEEKSEDEKAADAVTLFIESLPDVDSISLGQASLVEDARAEYLLLSTEAKQYVDAEVLAKLEALEEKIAHLQAEQDKIDAANKKAAEKVSKAIMTLYRRVSSDNPDINNVFIADKTKAENLKAEYDALTDAQKVYVSEDGTLAVLDEIFDIVDDYIAGRKALLASNFVTWDTVTFDGIEFYKVTEKEGKTLLLASDALRDDEGEPIQMSFGTTRFWRDSAVREYLNGTFLEEHPEINAAAIETELKTIDQDTDEGRTYITTNDRVFIMTGADILGAGSYYQAAFDNIKPDDFTVGGAVLPGMENNQAFLLENQAFFGRDHYKNNENWVPKMSLVAPYNADPYIGVSYRPFTETASIVPAFWVDSSVLE